SSGGARLLLEHDVEPGTAIRFEVPGTHLAGTGEVVFARMLESPMSVRFTVGVRLEHPRRKIRPAPTTLSGPSVEAAVPELRPAQTVEVKELAS
ncbi:MAG TPA: hypothetical protein VF021_08620, partial [Longimicrobiales bacterium]